MNGTDTSRGLLSTAASSLVIRLAPVCDRITALEQLPTKSLATREIRLLAVPKIGRFQNPEMLFDDPVETDCLKEKLQLFQKSGEVSYLGGDRYEFRFLNHRFPVRIFVTMENAWFAQLVQKSSFKDLYITIATAAKNLGLKWVPAQGGFEDLKTGKMRLVKSEEEVFEIAKLPFVPPGERNRGPVFSMVESGLPLLVTKEEMREWVISVPWTDTWCGGEFHQFTFRTSVNERRFVQIAEFIREIGYDGWYYGKKWRYVDLDGLCYFTCGSGLETTYLLNRKKITHPEKDWVKNPEPWVPVGKRDSN